MSRGARLLSPLIAYLTDVEGRWDKLVSFATGNPHVSLVDGELRLAERVTFVFGGDAIDRGAQGPDKLNQRSVVYARPRDEHGNP